MIDRGPFSGSREFDLTAATKQELGFPTSAPFSPRGNRHEPSAGGTGGGARVD